MIATTQTTQRRRWQLLAIAALLAFGAALLGLSGGAGRVAAAHADAFGPCIPAGGPAWGYRPGSGQLCKPDLYDIADAATSNGIATQDGVDAFASGAVSSQPCPATSRGDDRMMWVPNVRYLHGGGLAHPKVVRIETDHRWCFVKSLQQITKVWPERIVPCQIVSPWGSAGGWNCSHHNRFYTADSGKCWKFNAGSPHSYACVQTNQWHAWSAPAWGKVGKIDDKYPCATTIMMGSGEHHEVGDCHNRTGTLFPTW